MQQAIDFMVMGRRWVGADMAGLKSGSAIFCLVGDKMTGDVLIPWQPADAAVNILNRNICGSPEIGTTQL